MRIFDKKKEERQEISYYFIAVFEKLDLNHNSDNYHNWRWISAAKDSSYCVYRKLFLTPTALYEDPDSKHAYGCYKVSLTKSELAESKGQTKQRNSSNHLTLALSIEPEQIISYISADKIEYPNPFYQQQASYTPL